MSDETNEQKALIGDLTGFGKVADSKVINKAYDDAASSFLRELGGAATDNAITGRHVLGRMLNLTRERFDRWFEKIADGVPEEHRRDAPPEIVGPAIRSLAFMEEQNPLAQLYVELLKKCTDRRTPESQLHPAFTKILAELSPEEAWALYLARKHKVIAEWPTPKTLLTRIPDITTLVEKRQIKFVRGMNRVLTISVDHLISLNLLFWGRIRGREVATQGLALTRFGHSFVQTCVPSNFDFPLKDADTKSEAKFQEFEQTQNVVVDMSAYDNMSVPRETGAPLGSEKDDAGEWSDEAELKR